jgi:hypothetical protein
MTRGTPIRPIDSVQRIVAAGLLCLLTNSWLAPLLFSDPQSNLPACCRRDGKHRCSLIQMAGPATDDRNYTAAAPKCPLYPRAIPKAPGVQLYPFRTQRFFERIVAKKPITATAVIQYLVSCTPAHQKRGPPQFPSLD